MFPSITFSLISIYLYVERTNPTYNVGRFEIRLFQNRNANMHNLYGSIPV